MEVPLGRNAPNLYAMSLKPTQKQSWWKVLFHLPLAEAKTSYRLHLEGDFDKYFRIQLDLGEEVSAMQIFEPGLMAALIDTPYRYDFEILDQTLFIYAHHFIGTQVELNSFYKYAELISRPIYNEISSMHVSTEAAKPASEQLWPGGIFILNVFTLLSLYLGTAGLILAAYIAITAPGYPAMPALAATCGLMVVAGLALLGFGQLFRH
jgi:hypothetical protein